MLSTRERRRESISVLTREEEREPCKERGGRKRRESEGDGGHGERATEVGMAFVPLPPLNPCLAAHPAASHERHLRAVSGMTHKQSEAGRRGDAGNQYTGQSRGL